ncbi:DUF1924 domain-containing protein [Pseudomonadota bacterium]
MKTIKSLIGAMTFGAAIVGAAATAQAGPLDSIIAGYSANPNPAAGQAMYNANYAGKQGPKGKVETPKCQSCHGSTPQQGGETRTGKPIGPMAMSSGYRDPKTGQPRFVDQRKREKWFLRNCQGVLGRECTNQEKADFLSYMASQ